MSDLRIAVQVDGDERAVGAGTTAGDLLDQAEDRAQAVVAARVNGALRDLSHVVEEGDKVEPVTLDSDDGRMIMRHSTAHVLAQAVQNLFPEARLGIGPPIENGFYYDFDVTQPFRPEDLDRIEQRMRQIVKEGQRFARRVVSDDEARAELKDEPYKLEIIDQRSRASDEEAVEVGDGPLTIYDNLDPKTGDRRWRDLCRGPHVPSTRAIPAFKLLRSAGAYWRGSEKNPQLQRIYGTAWESKDALAQHLDLLKEVFQFLFAARVAEDDVMADTREERAELTAHETRTENANSHRLTILRGRLLARRAVGRDQESAGCVSNYGASAIIVPVPPSSSRRQ